MQIYLIRMYVLLILVTYLPELKRDFGEEIWFYIYLKSAWTGPKSFKLDVEVLNKDPYCSGVWTEVFSVEFEIYIFK